MASAWAGPLVESPTLTPCGREFGEPRVEFLVGEGRAVGGHGVDLVEIEPVAEQRLGLGALPLERGEAVVLDLVRLGVDAPVGGVGVAPLAADDDITCLGTSGQPGAEELLGAAVGAGGVEVADALGVGGVEQFMGALAQGVDAPVLGQVPVAVEIDVAGPADRGQAEPDMGGRGRGRGQASEGHRGSSSMGCSPPT